MRSDSQILPLQQTRAASLSCARYMRHLKLADANVLYQTYTFKQEIGQGAFGTVVEVVEKSNHNVWAMKIIRKSKVDKWSELENEIKILKFVNHPHIIYLHCIFETPKKLYLVLEKCKYSLQDHYVKNNPISEKYVKIIIYDMADTLFYLHENNIVHRDIKMQNILIKETDNPEELIIKLTDFGLSIVKTGRGLQNMMREYCGTLFYMSPEILNHRAYSELCDIWSLGIICYMLVYGVKPFCGKTEEELVKAICNQEPTYKSSMKVNPKAKNLISSMLSKKPENRINAALILNHPWITKNKSGKDVADYNVFEMMTQWKEEMKVESPNKDWDIDDVVAHNKKSSTTLLRHMSDRFKKKNLAKR